MMAGADPALGRRTTIGAAFITVAATSATRPDTTGINADAAGLVDYSNSSSWANDGRWG